MNHFDASLRPIQQGTLRRAMPQHRVRRLNLEAMGASSVTLSGRSQKWSLWVTKVTFW
jgi:hypothetical protein